MLVCFGCFVLDLVICHDVFDISNVFSNSDISILFSGRELRTYCFSHFGDSKFILICFCIWFISKSLGGSQWQNICIVTVISPQPSCWCLNSCDSIQSYLKKSKGNFGSLCIQAFGYLLVLYLILNVRYVGYLTCFQ